MHTVSYRTSPHSCLERFLKLCLADSCKRSAAEIVKAKKKCYFFPPGVDLNLAKSKFQPFWRLSHIMRHKVGIKKIVQSTQQKRVHSSAKCSNSMDSIPVYLGMVIHLPYNECLCCWWDIFKVKITLKKVFTCWQSRKRTDMQCNPTHKPINYGHKQYTRRQETKYILQIHLS